MCTGSAVLPINQVQDPGSKGQALFRSAGISLKA